MAGLFEKDLRLLLQRKQAILLFLAIAFIMGMSMDGTFVVGYTTFLFLILTMSTISYDEFDNGYAFLMTLPITPKNYIIQKYILCSITAIVSWVFSIAVCMITNVFKQVEIITSQSMIEAYVLLPIVFLLMSIMLPIHIKFGSEKSQIVLIAIMGIVTIVILGLKKLGDMLDFPIDSLLEKLDRITDIQAIMVFSVLSIACIIVSFIISFRIMSNKEF